MADISISNLTDGTAACKTANGKTEAINSGTEDLLNCSASKLTDRLEQKV